LRQIKYGGSDNTAEKAAAFVHRFVEAECPTA
jgi:hypothetical protein